MIDTDRTDEIKRRMAEMSEARKLKKTQERSRTRFDYLKNVTPKYFQAEYVKAQAEEICNYIKEIGLTPLNPWYSALINMASTGAFMSQFYLTYNAHGVIEPDYERIEKLILPDATPDDMPRSIIIAGS
jgi:hypothetical protein